MTALPGQPHIPGPVITAGRSRGIAADVGPHEHDSITASLSAASEWPAAFRAAGLLAARSARHRPAPGGHPDRPAQSSRA